MRYPVCKHKSHARRESFVGARVIMRDHERWVDCLEQDLQDFLGFSGWGRTC